MCGETAPCYEMPSGRLPQTQRVDPRVRVKQLEALTREFWVTVEEALGDE